MRTRRSTREIRRLSTRLLVSYLLLDISIGSLAATAYVEWTRKSSVAAAFLVAEAAFILFIQVGTIRRLLHRLGALRVKNPRLHHHYQHLFIFCKDPLHCARCQGWWTGFAALFATGLAIVAGLVSPTYITKIIGVPASIILGSILLSLTPIHGTVGRMYELPSNHWTEGRFLTGLLGFLFAVGALVIGEAVVFIL